MSEITDEERSITCHAGEPHYLDLPIKWQRRDSSPYWHCSYCGCVSPNDVRTILKEGGKLGGSDWKYGNPHKFYIYPKGSNGMYKWYNQHLADIEEPEFTEFATLLRQYAGIEFVKDEKGRVMYRAPYHGFQR